MMRFILDQKLQWKDTELVAQDALFRNKNDFKILMNDWPYGIDKKIIHLVVWTKFALEDDPETGDTRDDVKREIDQWVDEVFGKNCGDENVSTVLSKLFLLCMHVRLLCYLYICIG